MKVRLFNVQENRETEQEYEDWSFRAVESVDFYEVIKAIETNNRQGTSATKSRGEVAGGGKKPWAQKHTGRARHSTIRSPLWRKGGHTFSIKPREYDLKVNSKHRKRVMAEAFGYKIQNDQVLLLEGINLETPSTKKAQEILNQLVIAEFKSLIVTLGSNENVYKSFNNLPQAKVVALDELNVRDLVDTQYLVMEKEAFELLFTRSKKWIS